jgi:hypothetical protein
LGSTSTNYYDRNQTPYSYGKVIEVTKDEQGRVTIIYTPLEDRISSNGNEKQGIAHPFYPNNASIPDIGTIVPLLKGPSLSGISDVNNVTNQYDKSIYYLDPVSIASSVNNNTVSTPSEASSNTSAASYNNNNIGAASSPILPGKISTSKAAIQNNRLFTKDFFKKKGLTKEQAAGIMGNAEAECGFKVEMPPNQDTKGFSFGLIQWNLNPATTNIAVIVWKKNGTRYDFVNGFLRNSVFGRSSFYSTEFQSLVIMITTHSLYIFHSSDTFYACIY